MKFNVRKKIQSFTIPNTIPMSNYKFLGRQHYKLQVFFGCLMKLKVNNCRHLKVHMSMKGKRTKNNEQHKLLTIRSNSKQTSRFTYTSQTCNSCNSKAKNIGTSN